MEDIFPIKKTHRIRCFTASQAEHCTLSFIGRTLNQTETFHFSEGPRTLRSTHHIFSLEDGSAVGNRRTLIADLPHKQETGKIMSIRSHEESESERHAEGRAQDVPLVKRKMGGGGCFTDRAVVPMQSHANETTEPGKTTVEVHTGGRKYQEKHPSVGSLRRNKRTRLFQVTSWRRRCGATGCRGNALRCVGKTGGVERASFG